MILLVIMKLVFTPRIRLSGMSRVDRRFGKYFRCHPQGEYVLIGRSLSSYELIGGASSHQTFNQLSVLYKITRIDQPIYIQPPVGNCSVCRKFEQLPVFDAAHTRKPKFI